MTYTKKQFLEDVKKEAVALKKHATKEELERLNFSTFDPLKSNRCIYGQMTGSCYTPRSIELIHKCAPVFIRHNPENDEDTTPVADYGCSAHWSPIEKLVSLQHWDNQSLIDFLKGNRKDLVL